MRTFPTSAPIDATVAFSVANVRIVASERHDTTVEVRPTHPDRAADVQAAADTDVTFSNGRLRVVGPKRRGSVNQNESIEVSIEVPSGSAIRGDSAVGGFTMVGRLGECSLRTAAGNVNLDESTALSVTTAVGDVTVGRAVGAVAIATASGRVQVRELDGVGSIKNSNGSTTIGDVTGDLKIRSAHGDITVRRAHASLTAKTAMGNVTIGEAQRGSILIESAFGRLDVGIREGTAAWLDVASMNGNVHSSLTPGDGPGDAAQSVEIRARTAHGDISIFRAAAEVA